MKSRPHLTVNNPRCDMSKDYTCHPDGEVRLLPCAAATSIRLCRSHHREELMLRQRRNAVRPNTLKEPLPGWDSLMKVEAE